MKNEACGGGTFNCDFMIEQSLKIPKFWPSISVDEQASLNSNLFVIAGMWLPISLFRIRKIYFNTKWLLCYDHCNPGHASAKDRTNLFCNNSTLLGKLTVVWLWDKSSEIKWKHSIDIDKN